MSAKDQNSNISSLTSKHLKITSARLSRLTQTWEGMKTLQGAVVECNSLLEQNWGNTRIRWGESTKFRLARVLPLFCWSFWYKIESCSTGHCNSMHLYKLFVTETVKVSEICADQLFEWKLLKTVSVSQNISHLEIMAWIRF